MTIHSDIINGLFYITIYSGKEYWKKGHKIQTFSIGGNPYIRIDENKVKLDYLGDLPEGPIVKSESIKELEFQPEPTLKTPSSPRGSLPKGFTKELVQEPTPTPKEEESTPQQIVQLDNLQKQINKLEKEIKKSKSTRIKCKIVKPIRKQNKKLGGSTTKKSTLKSNSLQAYCATCKTKRKIKNPKKTTIKNGRATVKGFCSVCNCKVFKVVKMKK